MKANLTVLDNLQAVQNNANVACVSTLNMGVSDKVKQADEEIAKLKRELYTQERLDVSGEDAINRENKVDKLNYGIKQWEDYKRNLIAGQDGRW